MTENERPVRKGNVGGGGERGVLKYQKTGAIVRENAKNMRKSKETSGNRESFGWLEEYTARAAEFASSLYSRYGPEWERLRREWGFRCSHCI